MLESAVNFNQPIALLMNIVENRNSDIDAKFSPLSIFNSIFRFLGWISFAVIVPMFVVPTFYEMFVEFGIELPTMTMLAVSLSDRIIKFWFILLPLVVLMAAGAELLLLFLPLGTNRRILNYIHWVVFFIVVSAYLFTLLQPYLEIRSALGR